ncbi:hypothetical protein PIB30_071336 [Stylosanthes scabra]|uniref:CRC domain-containing protein n=1 Tax=Stylosanthes scabra TaxID=79078 RepID=A0ABU6SQ88_9FABA|nr:hypothetical protein [Stylosanthes scabra]
MDANPQEPKGNDNAGSNNPQERKGKGKRKNELGGCTCNKQSVCVLTFRCICAEYGKDCTEGCLNKRCPCVKDGKSCKVACSCSCENKKRRDDEGGTGSKPKNHQETSADPTSGKPLALPPPPVA